MTWNDAREIDFRVGSQQQWNGVSFTGCHDWVRSLNAFGMAAVIDCLDSG
jgi:Fe-S-cluster formation regulator IscX/YfhJ